MNEEQKQRPDVLETDMDAIEDRLDELKEFHQRLYNKQIEVFNEMERLRVNFMKLFTGVNPGDKILIEGRPGRLLYYETHPWDCVPIGAYDRKDGKPGKREIRLSFKHWVKAPEESKKEVQHG